MAPDADEWHWRGVPKKWTFATVYSFISTTRMMCTSLRVLLGKHLYDLTARLLGDLIDLPGHCILAGRP